MAEAIRAARDMASDIGLTEDEAAVMLTEGALEAAEAAGENVLAAVRRALPDTDSS